MNEVIYAFFTGIESINKQFIHRNDVNFLTDEFIVPYQWSWMACFTGDQLSIKSYENPLITVQH